jgi:hypothetical protein
MMSLSVIVASACFVLAQLALRSRSSLLAQGHRRRSMIKAVAAVRIISSAALVALLLFPLLERAAALPLPARWVTWLVAFVALLFCFVNAAAGIWILSPFVGADLGMEVVAAGRRGRISAYGLTRLELSTHAGWSAHLPYWLVALRPLRTSPRGGPCWVELRLRQDHWSDKELSLLRQAAIFSPYRDITSKVTVTCKSHLVTIRLGLTAGSLESPVQRQLEQALAELRAQPKRTSPP